MNGKRQHKRSGFTLVEILTVIVIIGILAGLAIPAITGALRVGRQAAIRAEVEGLAQGVEAYKLKYGDYPPDFSSWALVQRHYRKIFPDIATSELTLLYRMCDTVADNDPAQIDSVTDPYNPAGMDRGEALMWALGGFSSDPQLPFTGSGGPLTLIPTVPPTTPGVAVNPVFWQYNSERDNTLIDIELDRLTLKTPDPAMPLAYTNRVSSNDDVAPNLTDPFPVLAENEDGSPYVYFDSRTYGFDASGTGAGLMNGFATVTSGQVDACRPVFTNRINANLAPPSTTGSTYGTVANALNAWEWINPKTFQILSPGLDGRFGVVADLDGGTDPTNSAPVYWQYPTGKLLAALPGADNPNALLVPNVDRYGLDVLFAGTPLALEIFEKDNITNFTESTFEDDVE